MHLLLAILVSLGQTGMPGLNGRKGEPGDQGREGDKGSSAFRAGTITIDISNFHFLDYVDVKFSSCCSYCE